jgi:hypothetical protein
MERPRELQDPGEWLTWVDSNAPVGQREEDTGRILENRARVDFRATAAWIGEQPSGTNLIDPWQLPAIKLPPATSSLLLPQL